MTLDRYDPRAIGPRGPQEVAPFQPPTFQPPPRGEDVYDLLRGIVDRTPWRSEEEGRRFRLLLDRLEELNVFGHVAHVTTVEKAGG